MSRTIMVMSTQHLGPHLDPRGPSDRPPTEVGASVSTSLEFHRAYRILRMRAGTRGAGLQAMHPLGIQWIKIMGLPGLRCPTVTPGWRWRVGAVLVNGVDVGLPVLSVADGDEVDLALRDPARTLAVTATNVGDSPAYFYATWEVEP